MANYRYSICCYYHTELVQLINDYHATWRTWLITLRHQTVPETELQAMVYRCTQRNKHTPHQQQGMSGSWHNLFHLEVWLKPNHATVKVNHAAVDMYTLHDLLCSFKKGSNVPPVLTHCQKLQTSDGLSFISRAKYVCRMCAKEHIKSQSGFAETLYCCRLWSWFLPSAEQSIDWTIRWLNNSISWWHSIFVVLPVNHALLGSAT